MEKQIFIDQDKEQLEIDTAMADGSGYCLFCCACSAPQTGGAALHSVGNWYSGE